MRLNPSGSVIHCTTHLPLSMVEGEQAIAPHTCKQVFGIFWLVNIVVELRFVRHDEFKSL